MKNIINTIRDFSVVFFELPVICLILLFDKAAQREFEDFDGYED